MEACRLNMSKLIWAEAKDLRLKMSPMLLKFAPHLWMSSSFLNSSPSLKLWVILLWSSKYIKKRFFFNISGVTWESRICSWSQASWLPPPSSPWTTSCWLPTSFTSAKIFFICKNHFLSLVLFAVGNWAFWHFWHQLYEIGCTGDCISNN